jgi:hypothetical protein
MKSVKNVSIKFKPASYFLFRNLKYSVWLAIAEYVDNSVQSYLSNKTELYRIHNGDYKFQIQIKYENDHILIRDNAAGINEKNIQRAFEPANIPIDASGLNEFGLGMKTASIWLSAHWSVRTAAIGEKIERFIEFDLNEVTSQEKEELPVKSNSKSINIHFTEIILQNLTENAKIKQIDKIVKHISSIHRNLLRTGELEIFFNGESLTYTDPAILLAPYYKDEDGEKIEWKKNIEYSLGKYKVKGFIGLLDKMSTSTENGFSLFRRGRVIEGSHDEKFRPKSLSGQVGSPRYKRIFGELELEGFSVSFDKGSFNKPDELEYFLNEFKNELIKSPKNIILQAENYRLPKSKEQTQKILNKAIESFEIEQKEKNENPDNQFGEIRKEIESNSIENEKPIIVNKNTKRGEMFETKEFMGKKYNLKIEFFEDKNCPHFYFFETNNLLLDVNVKCSINAGHPFFSKYEFKDYAPIIQIIKSLVYAEITAAQKGTIHGGNIRLDFNNFIRDL